MAEINGKLDVTVVIVYVMVLFLSLEHVGYHVFKVYVQRCSLDVKSHHTIWWQVVIKGLYNFVIPLLQLLVQF
jgi:hypothetical protein